MPQDYKNKAWFLVVVETTDDHDWLPKVSDNPAPGNNFEFGPHGTICIADFGNHDKTDIDEYYNAHKDEFTSLDFIKRPDMLIDNKQVCPEIRRIA